MLVSRVQGAKHDWYERPSNEPKLRSCLEELILCWARLRKDKMVNTRGGRYRSGFHSLTGFYVLFQALS